MSAPSIASASVRMAVGRAYRAFHGSISVGAALVDHAFDVGHQDVLEPHAQRDQQVEAGQRRSPGTAGHQPRLLDRLALEEQPVADRRRDDDRRAVLVVVEDRDPHPLAQLALDGEALGRLDVLEVDGAEGRLERGHDLDQLVRVALVDLDVEGIDAGELLEQDRLALHHRLGGQGADGAEAEHGGAVGHDRDEVASGR